MKLFGDLEAEIMRILWGAKQPLSIREVLDELAPNRVLAHTTVITVAERLRSKGHVDRERHGRGFLYSARVGADDHAAGLMAEILSDSSDKTAALLRFADRLTPEEVIALRAALGLHSSGTDAQ